MGTRRGAAKLPIFWYGTVVPIGPDSALSQVERDGRGARVTRPQCVYREHTYIPDSLELLASTLGQADHSHVNAKPSWQGLHHTTGWVSLIPIDRHFRQLQRPERLHHRVAHARVRVIEPRNEGGAVLRERRRL